MIKSFKSQLTYSKADKLNLAEDYKDHIEREITREDRITFLDTFVDPQKLWKNLDNPTSSDSYLSIDLGGSSLKLAIVQIDKSKLDWHIDFEKGRDEIFHKGNYVKVISRKNITIPRDFVYSETVFSWMSHHIKEYLNETITPSKIKIEEKAWTISKNSIRIEEIVENEKNILERNLENEVNSQTMLVNGGQNDNISLGMKPKEYTHTLYGVIKTALTFSYPLKQTSIASATMLHMTKEFSFKVSGLGEDPGKHLQTECIKRGVELEIIGILNDTTATYISGYDHEKYCIGLVCGTGCNASFTYEADGQPKVINAEWGAFDSLNLKKTEVDLDLKQYIISKGIEYRPVSVLTGGLRFHDTVNRYIEAYIGPGKKYTSVSEIFEELEHIQDIAGGNNSDRLEIVFLILRRNQSIIASLLSGIILLRKDSSEKIRIMLNGSIYKNPLIRNLLVEELVDVLDTKEDTFEIVWDSDAPLTGILGLSQ